MNERLSLATSSGLPLLALVFHVGTALVALVAGFIAISARKGGTWHRRSGVVFAYTMIATGLSAAGISVFEGKSPGGGLLTAYFVFTAWTVLEPLPVVGRTVDIALMVFAFAIAAAGFAQGVTALGAPGNQLDGVPAAMMFFLATVNTLAAIGDARMIRAGGIRGTQRLARHLWRMCFGLFIATGPFVGQLASMQYLPAALRSVTVVVVLAAGPLVVLVFWMWRVRLKRNLRGLMVAKPPGEPTAGLWG